MSGGSDATIRLWDLEQCGNPSEPYTYKPAAQILRADSAGGSGSASGSGSGSSRQGHRFGITHVSFYPFDAAAFLSSSYDQTLRLWATDSARLSGSFDLGAKVYTHAVSPIADHLLVACATQHPAVRLVDLRSGAAVQSLVAAGQEAGGAVLSVAWSPRHEHVLASGAVDGTVRIWDVRRASALIALLDLEDCLGIGRRGEIGPDPDGGYGAATVRQRGIRASARAHAGPVNGLTWTDDGAYIVSAGHDRRIRVWDAATGANTLASFGPLVRNGGLSSVTMFASPAGLAAPRKDLLFWPNETEILVFDLHEGNIVTRLRGLGPAVAGHRVQRRGGERATRNRVTSIAWRGAGGASAGRPGPSWEVAQPPAASTAATWTARSVSGCPAWKAETTRPRRRSPRRPKTRRARSAKPSTMLTGASWASRSHLPRQARVECFACVASPFATRPSP